MQKFKIPSQPRALNKTIRFPVDLIAQIEDAICGKDCTFSAFVVEAVRWALENLEEQKKEAAQCENPSGYGPASRE